MSIISSLVGEATTAATDAASRQAAATYERFKPWLWVAALLLGTVYAFYYVPRFALPGDKVE